jgi:two-component system CheB/CheR fusion protein
MSNTSERDDPIDGPEKKYPGREGFLMVGLGASAGGYQALKQFFQRMPADCGMAFVVILHLSPQHKSNLAELLQRETDMPVAQVTETVKVEPNHVYVIPPTQHLAMTDGHIRLTEPEQFKGKRVPIDLFFRSLAQAYGPQGVCIILSGSGADGTLGRWG